jgi:hypothetical protein
MFDIAINFLHVPGVLLLVSRATNADADADAAR